MLKKLRWEAYSNDDRNTVIEAVKSAILIHDGCIVNFNRFSDLALTLSVEIEENKIQKLHEALSSVFNNFESEPKDLKMDSTKEWLLFINISFTQGKGDLKQEIPNVPG